MTMLTARNPGCWCTTCRPLTLEDMRFVVCPTCGNKRCPRAHNHTLACTGSNEPGQPGSSWEHVKPAAAPEVLVVAPRRCGKQTALNRELLALAAKAMGAKWDDRLGIWMLQHTDGVWRYWSPLTDDGDRHRLLVSQKMTLAHEPSRGGWSCGAVVGGAFSWLAYDEDEARAVVVAAAAIGEAMP